MLLSSQKIWNLKTKIISWTFLLIFVCLSMDFVRSPFLSSMQKHWIRINKSWIKQKNENSTTMVKLLFSKASCMYVCMYMYWNSLGITFENSLISFRVDSFWACCHVGKNIHSCIINLHMHLIKKFALIVLNTSVLYMSCTSVHCIY